MVGYFAEHSLFVKSSIISYLFKVLRHRKQMIFMGDPLVVHIDKKTGVGDLHTISLGNQNKKYLDIDDFASKNLFFEVKLLNLVEKDNCLFWHSTFTGTLQKVISENCVIIKPSVSANSPENVSVSFMINNFC